MGEENETTEGGIQGYLKATVRRAQLLTAMGTGRSGCSGKSERSGAMKLGRILALVVIAGIALAGAPRQGVRAQVSGTPSPISTPLPSATATPPETQSLWAVSVRAMNGLRDVHSQGRLNYQGGVKTQGVTLFQADCLAIRHGKKVNTTNADISLRLTIPATDSSTGRKDTVQFILNRKGAWTRLASTGGRWKKLEGDAVFGVSVVLGAFLLEVCPQPWLWLLTDTFGISITANSNRGLESVDGRPAWHLVATSHSSGAAQTWQVYVDAATKLWDRVALRARSGKEVRVTDTHYSRFNEGQQLGDPTSAPVPLLPAPTATASPTPVTTIPAGAPSGHDLLARATALLLHQGTAHLTFDNEFAVAGLAGGGRNNGTADLDFRRFPAAARSHNDSTWTVPDLGDASSHGDFVQVGGRNAYRENRRKWNCDSTKSLGRSDVIGWVVDGTLTTPVNVGSDTIDGTPVWHVQAQLPKSYSWSSSFAPLQTLTVDLYISQADGGFVRERESFTAKLRTHYLVALNVEGPATVNVVSIADFGPYGQPMTIRLPKHCGQ
jgi:hypothetical protein